MKGKKWRLKDSTSLYSDMELLWFLDDWLSRLEKNEEDALISRYVASIPEVLNIERQPNNLEELISNYFRRTVFSGALRHSVIHADDLQNTSTETVKYSQYGSLITRVQMNPDSERKKHLYSLRAIQNNLDEMECWTKRLEVDLKELQIVQDSLAIMLYQTDDGKKANQQAIEGLNKNIKDMSEKVSRLDAQLNEDRLLLDKLSRESLPFFHLRICEMMGKHHIEILVNDIAESMLVQYSVSKEQTIEEGLAAESKPVKPERLSSKRLSGAIKSAVTELQIESDDGDALEQRRVQYYTDLIKQQFIDMLVENVNSYRESLFPITQSIELDAACIRQTLAESRNVGLERNGIEEISVLRGILTRCDEVLGSRDDISITFVVDTREIYFGFRLTLKECSREQFNQAIELLRQSDSRMSSPARMSSPVAVAHKEEHKCVIS